MKKLFLIIIFTLLILSSNSASAASVSLYSVQSINTGDKFKVSVKIDTGSVAINSVDLTLNYPENIIEFSGYEEGQGLIKMWIDPPNAKNGQVHMSGVIPGGVNGLYDVNKKGLGEIPLAVLIFKAKSQGDVNLHLTKTQILKNDGLGSEIYSTNNDWNLVVKNVPIKDRVIIPDDFIISEDKIDTVPPNSFIINLIEPSILSSTPQMISFNTNDDESGSKYYEVKINNGTWMKASSPFVVHRGLFSKDVYVRAYDFSGNYKESSINVPGSSELNYLLLIIVIVVLSSFIWYKLVK